jgi:hypothetical protein
MLGLLKRLVTKSKPPPPAFRTPKEYPADMADIVRHLYFTQLTGTVFDFVNMDSTQSVEIMSQDPYTLGYMMGMFDCLCQHWQVPYLETPAILRACFGCAYLGLMQNDIGNIRAVNLGLVAFDRAVRLADDPVFCKGQQDGGSELKQYGETKADVDFPNKLHAYLTSERVTAAYPLAK